MDEHLHTLVLPEVERGFLIDGLRLSRLHVRHDHIQGLLVVLHQLRLRGVGGTADARGQHVVHGSLVVVLLDVHRTHREGAGLRGGGVQVLLVDTPLATHEVEAAEAEHDGLLESRHEHTHEAHAGEVVDRPHAVHIFHQGDAELIPVDARRVAITQFHATGAHVGDEAVGQRCAVAVGVEHLGRDAHFILIVALVLVEGEVLVDILHVGSGLVAGVVRLGLVFGLRRVALRVVVELISVEDALLLVVVVGAAEVVVVVAGRVVAPGFDDTVVGDDAAVHHRVEPLLIRPELPLLVIGKAVETHILQLSGTGGGGEGVGLCGLHRDLTPLGRHEVAGAVNRHTALIELLTIAQDILRDLTEVEVEVAAVVGGGAVLTGVDEGIEQPELDVLDVRLFEVVGLKIAHHTAPLRLGLTERTVAVEVARQVIRSALRGVVGQVQHLESRGGAVVGALVAVGIELLHIDLTHIVVRQLVEVALDVARRERRAAAGEDGIYGIPRQLRTVIAAGDTRLVGKLREHRRHARECPRLG